MGGASPRPCLYQDMCGWCNCTRSDRNLPKSGRKVRVAVTGPADKLSIHAATGTPPRAPPGVLEGGPTQRAQKQKLESPFPRGQCRSWGRYVCKDKSSMWPRFSAPQVTSGLCPNTSVRLFRNAKKRCGDANSVPYF